MSTITAQITLPLGLLNITRGEVRRAINQGMRSMGSRAYHFWQGIANEELSSSYQAYVNSMQLAFVPGLMGIDTAHISIYGDFPVAIELGSDSYDMKSRLHGSSGRQQGSIFDRPRKPVKISKKTGLRYAVIPMRHGVEKGSAGERRMHIPPAPIRRLMKGKPVGTVLRNISSRYDTVGRVKGYRSAVPRYEGLTKSGETGTHRFGGWYTFRTMTESQQSAWFHPGFKARMLHERVLMHIENTLTPEIFGPLLSILGV